MSKDNKQPRVWYRDRLFWVLFIVSMLVFYSIGASSRSNNPSPTAEQKPQDQPKIEVVKPPEPIKLAGIGQKATNKFTLHKGLAVFKMTHDGARNISMELMDSKGGLVSLLVNEIGAFDGSKAVQIETDGEYLIDVSADGNWTISIQQ